MKNLKFITTVAFLALFAGGLHAQTSIILTPEVGIHTSKLKTTGDADISDGFPGADIKYSSVFGYQGGIGVGIQLFKHWGIITGIKYNKKGGKVNIATRDPNNPFITGVDGDGNLTTDVGEFTVTTSHNWLSIPILARGQFGGAFKAGIAIGPQINMGIGKNKQTIDYDLENTNLSSDETSYEFGKSTTNYYKKSHISVLILPHVMYDISDNGGIKLSLMIEAGGNMINDNYVVGTTDGGKRNINGTERNTQMGIMLSYEHRFGLKTGVKY